MRQVAVPEGDDKASCLSERRRRFEMLDLENLPTYPDIGLNGDIKIGMKLEVSAIEVGSGYALTPKGREDSSCSEVVRG